MRFCGSYAGGVIFDVMEALVGDMYFEWFLDDVLTSGNRIKYVRGHGNR